MKTHNHPLWSFLSSGIMRTVVAGVLFIGMMLWTAWLLSAIVWVDGRSPSEISKHLQTIDHAESRDDASNSSTSGKRSRSVFPDSSDQPDATPITWIEKMTIERMNIFDRTAFHGPWPMNDSLLPFNRDPDVSMDKERNR